MTRILVVDDDVHVLAALRMLLEFDAIDIATAETAEEGVDALARSKFDMVFVDIFMPRIDGLKAIKEFRRRAPGVPIVAMSAFASPSRVRTGVDLLGMARRLGAAYFLMKPFRRGDIITAIETCLQDPLRIPSFAPDVATFPVPAARFTSDARQMVAGKESA
jgi:DNA-binding NtrC family response regulator